MPTSNQKAEPTTWSEAAKLKIKNKPKKTKLPVQKQEDVSVQHEKIPQPKQNLTSVIFVLVTLLLFTGFGIWMMQKSVNAYFQQTYHEESPLTMLDQYAWWSTGEKIGDQLYDWHDDIQANIAAQNSVVIDYFNQYLAFTPEYKAELARKEALERMKIAQQKIVLQQQALQQQALMDQFSLTKTDKVFFAGDSLMQGVAPYVQKYLQENYQIQSVNLSKQSTGLTYPKFFNWPKTVQDTLNTDKNIKVLVMFLGPNDPWDIPSSNSSSGHYLKFMSPEWEAEYRSRIANIIQTAKDHNVSIMWISPPNMKKPKLNEQMIYLNAVIADEVKKNNAYFIDGRPLVGGTNNIYSDYLMTANNSTKMRSADGIHFSPEGQKTIAKEIEKHLYIVNDD